MVDIRIVSFWILCLVYFSFFLKEKRKKKKRRENFFFFFFFLLFHIGKRSDPAQLSLPCS